jgi:hypothetical protein
VRGGVRPLDQLNIGEISDNLFHKNANNKDISETKLSQVQLTKIK